MNVTLSANLQRQVEKELASGHYRDLNQRRLDALRRIGQAVDAGGLYERVLAPDQE